MDSFMGWIGGKRILRKAILKRFPTDKVERYIEVFGGAAWVLFAKEKQAGQLEVYNDINGDLVNLSGNGENKKSYAEVIICSY